MSSTFPSLCYLICKRRIIESVCFTRVFSKSTEMIMHCSSLMSNEKVSYGCSTPRGCAQLWFWKEFAAGEVKPLRGAPGPADPTPLLPASSHLHHVFPISLSFAFPFRPGFLAIIVHHLPDAKSPQNPRTLELERDSAFTKQIPSSYSWDYGGSDRSRSYLVSKSEPEPGFKSSIFSTACHLRPFKHCTFQLPCIIGNPSAQGSTWIQTWYCFVKSVNLCPSSLCPFEAALWKPAPRVALVNLSPKQGKEAFPLSFSYFSLL